MEVLMALSSKARDDLGKAVANHKVTSEGTEVSLGGLLVRANRGAGQATTEAKAATKAARDAIAAANSATAAANSATAAANSAARAATLAATEAAKARVLAEAAAASSGMTRKDIQGLLAAAANEVASAIAGRPR